jgi:Spy/CpxP family protein refolding chaperone
MKQNLQARADMGVARIDLAKLMRAERPDREAIAAQIDRIAELRATMAKARMNALLDARGVLTPEQLKKARELHGGRGMGPHAGLDPGGPGGLGDMADPGDFDGPGPGDVPDAGIR